MKLMTVQEAINKVNRWVNIPAAYKLIQSGIFRNSEYNQTPYYKVELEWNKEGEPELEKNGLVNKHMIRAEIDAFSGNMVAFYRHDHRKDGHTQQEEMGDELYETVYPHILQWIGKLGLEVTPFELRLVKKSVIGEDLYEVNYSRQYDGIPLSSYQAFNIKLNKDFDLIHLLCRWDRCTFSGRENLIPPEVFKQRFDLEQLSLCYIRLLSSEDPYYVWSEDTFDAATGGLVCSDMGELVEIIDLDTTAPYRNQQVNVLKKPIFSADHYDCLRLTDDVTDVDLLAPHPFFPLLPDVEIARAKDIAVSYLKQYLGEEPYHYAFIRKEGREVVESMQGNQIRVEIHRMLYGIPIIGGGIRLVINRDTWEVNNEIDALELLKLINKTNTPFRKPQISIGKAWEKLKEKMNLKLHYRFDKNSVIKETESANLVYTLDCDWICDAVTGELTELT